MFLTEKLYVFLRLENKKNPTINVIGFFILFSEKKLYFLYAFSLPACVVTSYPLLRI
jgi:hypothetical protein